MGYRNKRKTHQKTEGEQCSDQDAWGTVAQFSCFSLIHFGLHQGNYENCITSCLFYMCPILFFSFFFFTLLYFTADSNSFSHVFSLSLTHAPYFIYVFEVYKSHTISYRIIFTEQNLRHNFDRVVSRHAAGCSTWETSFSLHISNKLAYLNYKMGSISLPSKMTH